MNNNLKDLVELKDFTKVYSKGKNQITACKNINFKAERGKITGLLGLNGAGKSTILKALSGAHYPSQGKVIVYGSEDNAYIRSITGLVPNSLFRSFINCDGDSFI